MLVPEATLSKRLTRAKQKITLTGIPYRVPSDAELPGRPRGVLATVYLIFNVGYAPSGGDEVVRGDIVDEAIRLGRLLRELMPDDPSVRDPLALMLLQDSRRAARADPSGQACCSPTRTARSWIAPRPAPASNSWARLRRSPDEPDTYAVQAAIAACHALTPFHDETDWTAIISWYDVLFTVDSSPAAQLGRASAVAEREGASAGLPEVDGISGLESHPWWRAARAELLHRLGRDTESARAREEAVRTGLTASHLRNLDESLIHAPRRP